MKNKVILIGGKIHSGKNQFAIFLQEHLKQLFSTAEDGDRFIRQDLFAHSLKCWANEDFKNLQVVLSKIADEMVDVITSDISIQGMPEDLEEKINKLRITPNNWYEDKTDITRVLLQTYGTDIMRKRVDDDFWAKDTKKRVKEKGADITIITDFRFPNEYDVMADEELDLYTVLVERGVETDKQIAAHLSENSLDDFSNWNYIVDNNSDLISLKSSAVLVAEDICNEVEIKDNEKHVFVTKWSDLLTF